jgi:transcriptional regulator with XRE-family HTH domain
MNGIGERLSVALKARGLPVYQAAVRSGLAYRTLFSLLRDEGQPRSSTLAKLAAALDVDADWLETGKGEAPVVKLEPRAFSTHEERADYGGETKNKAMTLRAAIRAIAAQIEVDEAAVAEKIAELLRSKIKGQG